MGKARNFHEEFEHRDEITRGSERGFGWVMAAFFAVVAAWPLLHGEEPRIWAAVLAAAFLGAGLAYPKMLAPLNSAWLKLGLLLGRIVNPIVLGVMYYLAVTPMALLVRLLGKDLLRLRRNPAAKSYWIPRQPAGPAPDTMRNQF